LASTSLTLVSVSRPLREREPGATFHVTSHAVENTPMVRNDSDRSTLVDWIGKSVESHGWDCLAFCIMDTHYHLLVTTPEPNLAEGMQYLNGCYAQGFNRRHGRRGHLFRERYYGGRILADGHLLLVVKYIALNPVAAHLAPAPAVYRWSSYAGAVGAAPSWSFVATTKLLEHFGPASLASGRLRALVEDAPGPIGGAP
jgi:REP element-mobilizing transposase RayT